MRKFLYLSILTLIVTGCKHQNPETKEISNKESSTTTNIQLNLQQANKLSKLPMACLQVEYPNKLGQTLGGNEDIKEPHQLHPAFYGCFDWHSAVHGHWSLVKLLKEYQELEKAVEIKSKLRQNITKENISAEVNYFQSEHSKSFERTYGWAWLLKLAEELHTWDDPLARELEENLLPLTNLIVNRYLDFLPKLVYPIRVGEHTNTAFGLAFAWDYAIIMKNEELKSAIASKAKAFYSSDVHCPLNWEPGGYDFLSPCFEEIDLMRRVLDKAEFNHWINGFAPQLKSRDFRLEPGKVSDRTDGKLVHLDGLNFSRAWVMYGLANQYNEFRHLKKLADKHINYSFPNLIDDSYEGGHWLASFAIYALDCAQEK